MKQSIVEAAYDYATEKTKFRKEVLKEVDADNYVPRHADCMEDFQCGVEWQKKRAIEVHKTLCPNHQNGSCTVFGKNKDVSHCWDTNADCDMKCKYMNGFINSL